MCVTNRATGFAHCATFGGAFVTPGEAGEMRLAAHPSPEMPMKRSLAGCAALVLLLAASRISAAPDVEFSGHVRDAQTAAPLAGTRVSLRGTSHRAVTNAAGLYRLRVPRAAIRGASVTLVASRAGYTNADATVAVAADKIRHDFALPAAAVALQDFRGKVAEAGRATASSVAQSMAMPAHPGPAWNTEAYDRIADNAFMAVAHQPLSTFAADVDRASYSNVRRFLTEGTRPPADAVRIEEMINYFPYAYPEPRGEHPVSVTTEVGNAPWRAGHRLVRIGLQSRSVDVANLPPSNLVFLLDVSGSMNGPDRLPLAKQAMRLLVEQLRPRDRVAIVVYAGAAGLVLTSTPGSNKAAILDAIERLEAGGSTAGGAGIRLAYEVARQNHIRGGNNRVILATDGDFNVGASSDGEMVRLIEEKRREGTFLTVLGFGRGNLKDAKMEKLADHGNGNYAYIDNLLEARKALVSEMGATLLTVAKDVKLQVEWNPARVQAYRLVGYENRLLAPEDFNDDTKDAGDLGAGHSVTALYEVIPVGVRTDARIRGVDSLRYQTPSRPAPSASGSSDLAWVKVRYKAPAGERSRLLEQPIVDGGGPMSTDFQFATAVAGFGMLLRESEHRGTLTLDQVIAMARRARGPDAQGYRAEFVTLAERFRALADAEPVVSSR